MNILLSLSCFPQDVKACDQFILSQAMSLGIFDALNFYLQEPLSKLSIKWPNDIYYKDYKICGFLVSCDIEGPLVSRCILGAGINVNQRDFESDAPNPISLAMIKGCSIDRMELIRRMLDCFINYFHKINAGLYDEIIQLYFSRMYRKKGLYAFKDSAGVFNAHVINVDSCGVLYLEDTSGHIRDYRFKEVSFVI